jgi:hypothetical protein
MSAHLSGSAVTIKSVMNYWTVAIMSYVIAIAAVIGLIRYRKILPAYRPFVWYACLSTISEIVSTATIRYYQSNVIAANIFVLAESLLMTYVFYNWTPLKLRQRRSLPVYILLLTVWIIDNLILHSVTTYNGAFRVVASFVLVLLSIGQLNRIIVMERMNVLKNASFLISIAVLIFFSYKSFLQVFYAFELEISVAFDTSLFYILIFINLFTNLIYVLASLCLPSKQKLSLQY